MVHRFDAVGSLLLGRRVLALLLYLAHLLLHLCLLVYPTGCNIRSRLCGSWKEDNQCYDNKYKEDEKILPGISLPGLLPCPLQKQKTLLNMQNYLVFCKEVHKKKRA